MGKQVVRHQHLGYAGERRGFFVVPAALNTRAVFVALGVGVGGRRGCALRIYGFSVFAYFYTHTEEKKCKSFNGKESKFFLFFFKVHVRKESNFLLLLLLLLLRRRRRHRRRRPSSSSSLSSSSSSFTQTGTPVARTYTRSSNGSN